MSTESTQEQTSTTTTAPVTTPPPATTAAPADWTSGFSDELKGFVATKQFKDPGVVVESYRNLEKLAGGGLDKLLKLPEKADAPEWNDIYNKLGRPEKADGYKLPLDGRDSGDFAKEASNWFHEAGLSQRQAEKVATKWNEFQTGQQKANREAIAAKNIAEEASLKTKWGSAYDQNIGAAQAAAKKFGIDASTIDGLEKQIGYAKTMEFFQSIGAGLGEHGFVDSTGGKGGFNGGALTPAQAQAQITELRSDPSFVQKFAAGDADARSQMKRLMQFANPGDTVI